MHRRSENKSICRLRFFQGFIDRVMEGAAIVALLLTGPAVDTGRFYLSYMKNLCFDPKTLQSIRHLFQRGVRGSPFVRASVDQ